MICHIHVNLNIKKLKKKKTERPFTGKGYRAKEPLELLLSDLCGLMNVNARGGFEYFIFF